MFHKLLLVVICDDSLPSLLRLVAVGATCRPFAPASPMFHELVLVVVCDNSLPSLVRLVAVGATRQPFVPASPVFCLLDFLLFNIEESLALHNSLTLCADLLYVCSVVDYRHRFYAMYEGPSPCSIACPTC